MSRFSRLKNAGEQLVGAVDRNTSLCEPIVGVLSIDGASVSTLGRPFEPENVCASGEVYARLAQAELDLGEGPAWTAARSRVPVGVPDIRDVGDEWPLFADAVRQEAVRAIHALPLSVGSLAVGILDLYCLTPGALDADEAVDAAYLATIVAREVLQRALVHLDSAAEPRTDSTWFSRREVHQATGMLIAFHGVSSEDALALLRARAFAVGRPLPDVAAAIVNREMDIDSGDAAG